MHPGPAKRTWAGPRGRSRSPRWIGKSRSSSSWTSAEGSTFSFRKEPILTGWAILGVSYGGAMGGLFAGVEHRLRTAVLVVGDGGLVSHFTLTSDPTLPWARVPPIQRSAWVSAMEPIEPIYYVGHAAPASLLFQNGLEDGLVPPNAALQYQHAGSEPKEARWYRAGHGLNPEAECDQLEWLDHSLRLLGAPDPFLCPQDS